MPNPPRHNQLSRLLVLSAFFACGVLAAACSESQDLSQSESAATKRKVSAKGATQRGRADAKNADGTYGKDRVDPVKLNGPIFEKWPKPKVALIFSGAQDGYIEPCGCAGLENQKGGLSRRHQLIKQLQADGWPVAAFDAGGLVKRYGRQQELKFAAAVDALKTMKYGAVTFGGEDLRLSLTELISAVTSVDDTPSPFVATNAALVSFDAALVARHQIVEAGGMRFGVLAVIGQQEQRQVNNPEIQFTPADKAIAQMLPEVQKQRPDKLILLAHATQKEAQELAEKFAQFDYVVTPGDTDEPPPQAEKIGKRTKLIRVGHKGMYCVVLGLYDDRKTPERYQRVPLDARFGESAAMQQVMVSYQEQLQAAGLASLNLLPPSGLPKHSQGQNFVGSEACRECHTKAYEIWKNTPHLHATETLVKLSPPRHYDPECLSCHVTGWDPQGYFPYASGYLDLKQKHLHASGCENCHGPGARHVAAQLGDIDVTDKELKSLQLTMRVTKEQAKENLCIQCHDPDNSPHFDWDIYWPKVEHKGKD